MAVSRKRKSIRQYQHIDGVQVSAKFSACENFRFRFEVAKRNGKRSGKTVCFVMQNPSYACKEFADRSVKILEKVVFEKDYPELRGVTKLVVVNQFARIQTHNFNGLLEDVGRGNDAAIEKAVRDADIVIVAWGKSNRFKSRQDFVRQTLSRTRTIEKYETATHPSRIRYEGFLRPIGSSS